MNGLLSDITRQFTAGRDVDESTAEPLLDEMIASGDEEQLAQMFRAWNEKGISGGEIYSIARVLRERCLKVKSRHGRCADIVGTGGSSTKTFNVSTASAFVVAGAGVPVAKHGNRAATSSSGSADVLAELGIRPDITPSTAEKCLNTIGICFMYAPSHHRLSPTLAKVRRDLGFPTIFNCVGPLCNPAGADHQVIGVWDRSLVPRLADALARLGTSRSWIVNGHDDLDEISTTGRTVVAEVRGGTISSFEVNAADIGIGDLAGNLPRGCSAQESARVIRSIIGNGQKESDAEKLVLLNAAAAIYVAGAGRDLRSAYDAARESIRSGRARSKLNELSQLTTG